MSMDNNYSNHAASLAGENFTANSQENTLSPEHNQNFELQINWQELQESVNQTMPYIQSMRNLEAIQSDISSFYRWRK